MQTLTLEQLRATQEAGGVLTVTLRGEGAAFEVQVETRRGLAKLIKARKARTEPEARRFADPRKALLLLRELGIREAHIDSQKWRPEDQAFERTSRPDRAAALKEAHSAAAYDKWFREQVQQALDDPRPSIPHAEVKAEFAERRAALRQRIAKRGGNA